MNNQWSKNEIKQCINRNGITLSRDGCFIIYHFVRKYFIAGQNWDVCFWFWSRNRSGDADCKAQAEFVIV